MNDWAYLQIGLSCEVGSHKDRTSTNIELQQGLGFKRIGSLKGRTLLRIDIKQGLGSKRIGLPKGLGFLKDWDP